MAEKRKRGQNFTTEEKGRLVKLLKGYKDTILNKKTDGVTNEAKSLAWVALTDSFNTNASIYRSKDSLIRMWEKLKSDSKIYANTKKSTIQAGRGPAEIKVDRILDQVCAIVGLGCTEISGVFDSDSTEMLPFSDDISLSYENVSNPKILKPYEPEILLNETSNDVSSLRDSFKGVKKKKEDIESLKMQLLKEEIEFKRNLYDVQLKCAEKELEIKDEILTQIRGGVLPLNNLFGVQDTKP